MVVGLTALAVLWAGALAAQETSGQEAAARGGRQLIRLVDCPTAGLVEKARFGVDLRLFPNGGVAGQLNAGVMRRLAIGISYGGMGIIGDDDIDWYPRVEAAVRYRVVEESGPDHARRFTVEVTVNHYAYRGEGAGRRVAEKNAAEKALQSFL